jgi:NAD(P) transhydrogenase subunit beta
MVLKRTMHSGFAGVENPLFSNPHTAMLFGDAKASILEITSELKSLLPQSQKVTAPTPVAA